MNLLDYLDRNSEEFRPWLIEDRPGRIEIKILKYLKEIQNGFFIEAGAFDGLFQSNTKILEDCGWSGILIEPSPKMYEKCRKNRSAIVENAILSSESLHSGLVFNYLDSPTTKIIRTDSNSEQQINVVTLTKILDKHGVVDVDFFSLDVEGFELEVLKGIDFDRFKIRFILVEVNSDSYNLKDLTSFLDTKGYRIVDNISKFNLIDNPTWPGNHQDYLFEKII